MSENFPTMSGKARFREVYEARLREQVTANPARYFPPKADIYVLAFVCDAVIKLVGWAWAEEMEARARYAKGEEAGPYWWLPGDELHTIGALMKELR